MAVSTVAWSPDGRRLASGSWETKTLTIWDSATAKRLLVLPGRAGGMGVFSVAWSPDGRRLASLGIHGQKTVTVWDTSDGREMPTLDGHTQSVNCVAWTRDGKRLATASVDNAAKIWDPTSGQELFSLVGSYLAWSPDGKQLAVSQEGAIRIYDASSGYALARGPGHQAEANRPQSTTHMLHGSVPRGEPPGLGRFSAVSALGYTVACRSRGRIGQTESGPKPEGDQPTTFRIEPTWHARHHAQWLVNTIGTWWNISKKWWFLGH
jgi:dipeptidyl aminopeptidase/acylaminoacyl peptidase